MADEVPTSAPRLQNTATAETGLPQCIPDCRHHSGIGVMGVENRRFGLAVLLARKQLAQPIAFGIEGIVASVEDLRDRAPPRPSGQHTLFRGSGRAVGRL